MIMVACSSCHSTKVKCDHALPDRPCSRCVRLNLECILHESRQGQRVSHQHSKRQRTGSTATLTDGLPASEDACLSIEVKPEALRADHFGLHYLIRSWVSMAFRRRTFALLSRASNMAARCGISMDQILCETERQRGCDFLFPILLVPTPQQQVTGPRLQYAELPKSLLTAVDCPIHKQEDLGSRWIWIRDMNKGVSRYFLSREFEQNVVSFKTIEETYRANEKAVVDLFVSPNERIKHTRCLASQISIHGTPGLPPRPSRLSHVNIKTISGIEVEVDHVCCIEILDVDHAYLYYEYMPKGREVPQVSSSKAQQQKPLEEQSHVTPAMQSLVAAAAPDMDLPFLDLDNLEDDKDLELMLELLQ